MAETPKQNVRVDGATWRAVQERAGQVHNVTASEIVRAVAGLYLAGKLDRMISRALASRRGGGQRPHRPSEPSS